MHARDGDDPMTLFPVDDDDHPADDDHHDHDHGGQFRLKSTDPKPNIFGWFWIFKLGEVSLTGWVEFGQKFQKKGQNRTVFSPTFHNKTNI